MSEHVKNVCKHGTILSQCRCASPDKKTIVVECPASHAEWSEVVFQGSGQREREKLVELIKRISPIKHEPLASAVAEEWADEFQREGWHL